MKQYSLAVLIITYSWIDVNCTNCAMMRHWGSAIMVVSKEWNKDAHQWSLVGFIFFLQVFIVLAALLFGGAGYEIYIFLKTQRKHWHITTKIIVDNSPIYELLSVFTNGNMTTPQKKEVLKMRWKSIPHKQLHQKSYTMCLTLGTTPGVFFYPVGSRNEWTGWFMKGRK